MKAVTTRLPYLAGRARSKAQQQINAMRRVHQQHWPLSRQLIDCSRLLCRRHPVWPWEYLSQGMYNAAIFPRTDAKLAHCGGWRLKEYIHSQLNNLRWEGMVTDKLVLYSLFRQFELPFPALRAAAWPRARCLGDIPVYHDAQAMADFLRGCGPQLPLFCKPVKGSFGRGAMCIEDLDLDRDRLRLSDGRQLAIPAFIRELQQDGWGFLLQDAVQPAAETRPYAGDTVTGCRVVMLLDDDGAEPFRVVWKLPASHNISDNFCNGSSGNMVAAIDTETGRVIRTVSGTGNRMVVNRPHAETGARLVGQQVPQWEAMMQLLKRASECFPGFRWQHWDVGLGAEGPVLYELNSAGNTAAVQVAYGKGILDDRLRDFLRRHGGREPRPGALFPD